MYDPCDDLLIGGTLSGTSIIGGTSIANRGISVRDYAGLWGPARQRGLVATVSGQAGGVLASASDRLPAERLFTLPIFMSNRNPATGLLDGGITSPAAWVEANQDTVDEIIHSRDGFLVEYVRTDGSSRYLRAWQNGQPSIQTLREAGRVMLVQCVAPYPYWRQVNLTEGDTITTTDTVTVTGTAPVYDATLVFAGDGYFENLDTGQRITVSGSGSAVTVVTGDGRTVTQGGVAARNLVTVNDDEWLRLDPGVVNVESDVSVVASWRPHWVSA